MVLTATFLTLGLMWAFLGTSRVPVDALLASTSVNNMSTYHDFAPPSSEYSFSKLEQYFSVQLTSAELLIAKSQVSKTSTTVDINVSFATYMFALTGWVGWFFFVVFGGIGLASLPIDLLKVFVYRPKIMSKGWCNIIVSN